MDPNGPVEEMIRAIDDYAQFQVKETLAVKTPELEEIAQRNLDSVLYSENTALYSENVNTLPNGGGDNQYNTSLADYNPNFIQDDIQPDDFYSNEIGSASLSFGSGSAAYHPPLPPSSKNHQSPPPKSRPVSNTTLPKKSISSFLKELKNKK